MSHGDERPAVRPYDFWWRSPHLRRHPGDLALLVAGGWHLLIGYGVGRELWVRSAGQPGAGLAGALYLAVVVPVLALSLGISVLLCRRSVGAGPGRLLWRGTWSTAVGLAAATALAAGYVLVRR